MPFDGTLSRFATRRAILSERLRNDREWEWNFCCTAGCALGMAQAIWPQYRDCLPGRRWFGMTEQQYADIFGWLRLTSSRSEFYGMHRRDVTPQMVANALDAIDS